MKIIPYVILLFLPFIAEGVAVPLSGIKAQDANYNGKTIVLIGDVSIDHQFGKLYCDKATLLLQPADAAEGRNFAPEKILLEGKVRAELQNGNSLNAQFAEIDCLTLEGVFTAQEPEKVVCVTFIEGKNDDKKTPVRTSSQSMRVKMVKAEKTAEYVFSELKGEGKVSIEYLTPGE